MPNAQMAQQCIPRFSARLTGGIPNDRQTRCIPCKSTGVHSQERSFRRRNNRAGIFRTRGSCRRRQHIRLALIGCGNRGAGAVANALKTMDQGPIKLFAMADLQGSQIESKLVALTEKYPDQVDVFKDRGSWGSSPTSKRSMY